MLPDCVKNDGHHLSHSTLTSMLPIGKTLYHNQHFGQLSVSDEPRVGAAARGIPMIRVLSAMSHAFMIM